MTLSDLSIKKPVFAWMLMAALLIFGGISFLRMGVSQNPDIDFPIVNISMTWEGAAPEVMETEVVDVVEESLMTVEGVKKITSSVRFGSANITAEFNLDKEIDVAVQEVQTKIAQAQRRLPIGVDPAVISKVNPEDQPIIWVGVSGERPRREIMEYVRDQLKDQFSMIPGVGEVFLGGYIEPNVRIWLDNQKLNNLQMTAEDVISAIQSQHTELPVGRLVTNTREQNVRIIGEAATIEEMSNISIPSRVRDGYSWKTFKLGDVAQIKDGLEDARRLARIQGKPSVGLGIKKQRGANSVEIARAVKAKIAKLQPTMPEGMRLTINFDGTVQIEENVHELEMTLILAVLFTGIVCWLFLGSISSTINVVLAIPTALGGAFIVMYFLGFTLNTITLLGLSMVVGIVVDDAIVVLENIVRHFEKNKSKVLASIIGSREITFSVIVISAAVIAIFLPVAFMKGIIGKFFFQFGITVSAAVAFSLLEALTLTPSRSSQMLYAGHESWVGRNMDRVMGQVRSLYQRTLGVALNHRWTIVFLAAGFFVASLMVYPSLRKELSPTQDISRFLVRLQTAPGSSLEFTDNAVKPAEKFLMELPEVELYFGSVGGFGGGEVNSAMFFVTLKAPNQRPIHADQGRSLTQSEVMDLARLNFSKIPGIKRAVIQDISGSLLGGGRDFPMDVSIQGKDWIRLGELAHELMGHLKDKGFAVDVDTNYMEDIPEIHVIPDREKASQFGVTTDTIARTIQGTLGSVRVAKFTNGSHRYDVRVSLRDENRKTQADISKIWVRNQRGELVKLSQVTKIIEKPQPITISRENRQRSVRVYGNIATGQSQGEVLAEAERYAKEKFPDGYVLKLSGSAETMRESFQELMLAFILGIVIAYMILAAQFNSFIHPFIILLALPFSVSGAFLGLKVMDHSINMLSVIGLLLLMGIVKKNSILLVEFTNKRREDGLGVIEALKDACPMRLRPILMTTFAIVAGALPAALTLGPGAELRAPMATVIIWGTLISTLFTLYVVPCAYSLFTKLESTGHQKRHEEAMKALAEAGDKTS
jgi:hydrophobe/amphiphile efflux-1 (HAE1) family protein